MYSGRSYGRRCIGSERQRKTPLSVRLDSPASINMDHGTVRGAMPIERASDKDDVARIV